LGVCGSDVAYVAAAKNAPPAHVDFIDFLWPFLVIIFSGFLPKEKFTVKHLLGGFMGMSGVFLLLTGGEGFVGFKPDYFNGYAFALCSALIWSAYTIAMRWFTDMPMEMVGMFCGVGALFSFGLHLHTEVWVTPSFADTSLVLLLGLSSGLAYLLWSYGTQKGNIKLLGVLAYFTPVFSMSLLVLTGKEPMSIALILACILVVSGVIIGSMDWGKVRLFFFKPTPTEDST
jgi:drug/metabolite transporter (DMT)-like permease